MERNKISRRVVLQVPENFPYRALLLLHPIVWGNPATGRADTHGCIAVGFVIFHHVSKHATDVFLGLIQSRKDVAYNCVIRYRGSGHHASSGGISVLYE